MEEFGNFYVKEVKLDNFKSYSKSVISFEKGINVILGENGAGKTSILEAILIALFGKVPSGKLEDYINIHRSLGYFSVGVKLALKDDSLEMYVERKIERNSHKARLEIKEEGKPPIRRDWDRPTAINSEIIKYLGIPQEVFENIFFIKQGQIAELIEDRNKEKRSELIESLMGLEKYEDILEYTDELRRNTEAYIKYVNIDETKKAIKNSLEIVKQYKVKISDNEKQLNDLRAELEKLKNEKEKIETEIKEYERAFREREELKERREKIINEIGKLEKRKAELEKEMEHLVEEKNKLESKKGSFEEVKKQYEYFQELRAIQEKLTKSQSSYSSLQTEIKALKERIEALKKDLEKRNNERIYLEEKVEILKEFQNRFEGIVEELRKQIDLYDSTSKKNFETLPENIKKEVLKYLKEGMPIDKVIDAIRGEVEKVRNEREEIKGNISRWETELSFENERKGILESAESKCPVCDSPLSPHHKASLIQNINEKTLKLKEKIENSKKELKEKENILRLWEKELPKIEHFLEALKNVKDYAKKLEVYGIPRIYGENWDDNPKVKDIKSLLGKLTITKEKIKSALYNTSGKKSILETEIKRTKNELESLERGIEEKSKELQKLEELQKQLLEKVKLQNLEEINQKISELQNIPGIFRKLQEEMENLSIIESKVKEIERRLNEVTESIVIANREKEEIEKRLTELEKFSQDIYQEKMKELREKEGEIARVDTEVKNIQNNIEEWKKLLENSKEQLKKQIKEIEDYKVYTELASGARIVWEVVQNTVENYKTVMMEKISNLATDIYSAISGERDLKLIALVQKSSRSGRGKAEILLKVQRGGSEIDIPLLSGGEKIMVGLAFRLAFSFLLLKRKSTKKLPILILDEPTHFLDVDKISKLRELIQTQLINFADQIIIITHEETLKIPNTNIIYIVKDGFTSSPQLTSESRI